ncbi:MAG: iron uptake porin [Oscillatoriales cyanobacterium SM2_1_8]|nr:iron uptake porin [Oscillatoriales cyanobacterium SM2_1_8]
MLEFQKLSSSPKLLAALLLAAGSSVTAAGAVSANEGISIQDITRDPMTRGTRTAQVTSVSQLSDVRTTDWAFTALQSLVERYGCIAGYPDRTYRGQRAMTRFEFAAGLNACLDKINELITAGLADKVSKEDLATLQRLQEEFAAELAALKGRVDSLEAKVEKLEAQQFSTTTKLNGLGVFAYSGTANEFKNPATGALLNPSQLNNTFSGRVRLNFDTSFTGRDRLRTRLEAGNVTNFSAAIPTASGGRMSRLSFETNTNNEFVLGKLFYQFPVGSQFTAFAGTRGLDVDDIFNPVNPFASAENGALSRFGRYNPLLLRSNEQGAGVGLSYKASDSFRLTALYLTNDGRAGNATGQAGVTNGGYSAGAQLQFNPSRDLTLALQYMRTFEPGSVAALDSSTGSALSGRPFGSVDTSADRYGFLMEWRVSRGFIFAGSVGFANAKAEAGVPRTLGATADLLTWDVKLAFPDLFGRGNLAGIIFGQQPRVSGNTIAANNDPDTSYHLEGLIRFQVNRNISITPGVFVVFNPNHDSRNNSIVVGTIRTTFSF